MACCRFDTKPISEATPLYCHLVPKGHFSKIWIKHQNISLRKSFEKCQMQNVYYFAQVSMC